MGHTFNKVEDIFFTSHKLVKRFPTLQNEELSEGVLTIRYVLMLALCPTAKYFLPVNWEVLRRIVLNVKIYLQNNVPAYILFLVFLQVS